MNNWDGTVYLNEYQKWDYITLSDFRSSSCGAFFSYVWLWFLAIIAVAVYGLDTFTAVNLLAFDKWSSTFDPVIELDVAKWIFAGCILFSWLLCAYEWFRAIRVMRRGNVAESYLDPLAVVAQSMRIWTGGQGWRRFLVFAELTKSRKGADYVALFVYFEFKGAIRVLLAEGPRQVVNALTLYSVMRARLIIGEGHTTPEGTNAFIRFWDNVKFMYEDSPEQAVVLSTMLFTFVIWVFSAICLLAACILWATFLWHYLPRDSGSLKAYCRQKVDKRLSRIVGAKAKEAIAKQEEKRKRNEEKRADVSVQPLGLARQPTLPMVDEAPTKPSLQHSTSVGSVKTMQSYSSTERLLGPTREPTLPNIAESPDLEKGAAISVPPTNIDREQHAGNMYVRRPGPPTRSATQSSGYSSTTHNSGVSHDTFSQRPVMPAQFDNFSTVPRDRQHFRPEPLAERMDMPDFPPQARYGSQSRTGESQARALSPAASNSSEHSWSGQQPWRGPSRSDTMQDYADQGPHGLQSTSRTLPPGAHDHNESYELQPTHPRKLERSNTDVSSTPTYVAYSPSFSKDKPSVQPSEPSIDEQHFVGSMPPRSMTTSPSSIPSSRLTRLQPPARVATAPLPSRPQRSYESPTTAFSPQRRPSPEDRSYAPPRDWV